MLSKMAFAQRETLSFDKGWQFHLGDIPFPIITGHGNSYMNAKAGQASGGAAPGFDDKNWRTLNLPHDWAIENPIDSSANLSQGYRNRGFGWYRRKFKIDAADRGKHFEIQFDGIATNATIWVNGTIVHRNWCGYTSSYIDITSLVQYDDNINTIAVRVDANQMEGWWYEGAGIYRHTWLIKRNAIHISTDGVFANPIKLADGSWQIPAEVSLANSGKNAVDVSIEMTVFDKQHKAVANSTSRQNIKALDEKVSKLNLPISNPKLWSFDEPNLYTVETKILQGDTIIDKVTTKCGFRTLRFDANTGFYLNDKPVKIKGTCNHQDHAGVGVAVPNALWKFRIEKLKEMGSNAYRCSHNPPAKEFLDACDSLGMMVMDENRNFNPTPEYVRQLEWLVRRDRNHPSVILWSVFNEEPMQASEQGYEMVRRMSEVVKKLDTTRPVTAAMNWGMFAPINVSLAVDLVGFNYNPQDFEAYHKQHPTFPLTSSEDGSTFMMRGEYVTDRKKATIDSYDTQVPGHGINNRDGWKAVDTKPYMAGCFVWTGFDYHGEPAPYEWPAASSNFGIMDICGFPKSAFYIRQAQWLENKNILELIPHWNWPADSIGKPIKVMALTNAESIKLFLNGKLISEKPVDKYEMVTWMVPYQPGKLEAIGYKSGKKVSASFVETTGDAVSLQLIPDRKSIDNNGTDAITVTVKALDAKGRAVPTANSQLDFKLKGDGEIIGLGNGNPNDHDGEKAIMPENRLASRKLYNGLAQVILQAKGGAVNPLQLTVKATGLKSATASIIIDKVQPIPSVPLFVSELNIEKWTLSKPSATRLDPTKEITDFERNNNWMSVKTGELQQLANNQYIIYNASFKPYPSQQTNGGQLILKNLTGKAEIWINRKLVGTKATAKAEDFVVKFPAYEWLYDLNVLIQADGAQKVGLGGAVKIVD